MRGIARKGLERGIERGVKSDGVGIPAGRGWDELAPDAEDGIEGELKLPYVSLQFDI